LNLRQTIEIQADCGNDVVNKSRLRYWWFEEAKTREKLRWVVVGTLESEFLDPVAERVGCKPRFLRRRAAFDDASGLIEHRGNVRTLELFKRKGLDDGAIDG